MSKQIVCDSCVKVCEPGKEFSAFMFTGFGMQNGQLIPQVRQEEYCFECTEKVKRAVETIKRQINENPADKQ